MTAIVLGNGKTLNDLPDMMGLRLFVPGVTPTFGCNHLYLAGINPTYYVAIDEDILKSYAIEIFPIAARAKVFYTSSLFKSRAGEHPGLDKLYALNNAVLADEVLPAWEGEKGVFGASAVYVSLKAAFYAGHRKIYLLGVDHEEAWMHFTPDYPRPRLPDRGGMEGHFRIAAAHYRAAGGQIYNLSEHSALDEIFERYVPWDTRNRPGGLSGDISHTG